MANHAAPLNNKDPNAAPKSSGKKCCIKKTNKSGAKYMEAPAEIQRDSTHLEYQQVPKSECSTPRHRALAKIFQLENNQKLLQLLKKSKQQRKKAYLLKKT